MVYAADKAALICELVTWVATDTSLTAPAEDSMYQDCLRYVALPFAIEADNPLLQGTHPHSLPAPLPWTTNTQEDLRMLLSALLIFALLSVVTIVAIIQALHRETW